MSTKSRINSILKSTALESNVTGIPCFHLSQLDLPDVVDCNLPTNVRLGHLAEKVVSALIKASTNYQVLFENIQIMEGKNTVGELDFVIKALETQQVIHLELAYKFYLLDPTISADPIHNWIGPNRNDSLSKKLHKLKSKQFPLLHHPDAKKQLGDLDLNEVTPSLCLLSSLFIPYQYKGAVKPGYKKAVRGYYLDFENFRLLDNSSKTYSMPHRREWGMGPEENVNWFDYEKVVEYVRSSLKEKQAVLCWQKEGSHYSQFFIVWW